MREFYQSSGTMGSRSAIVMEARTASAVKSLAKIPTVANGTADMVSEVKTGMTVPSQVWKMVLRIG